MSAHKLRVLLVVAVVAVVLALWSSQVRQPQVDTAPGGVLWPGLLEQLDRASALAVSRGGETLLEVELNEGAWGVAQRDGYPADMTRLREYLLKLAESRLVEPKTSNPGNYVQIGVEDPAAADAGSMLVTVRGVDPERSLIVGRYNGQGSGTFVRMPEDAQSWLANADLTLNTDPTQWLRRDIADVPSSQVRRLELVHGDGAVIRASKADEAASVFEISDVPTGRELSSEFVANGLAGFLASLRLDDVRSAADVDVPEDAIGLTYDTFDGRRYAMQIWSEDDLHLLSMRATLVEPAEIIKQPPLDTPDSTTDESTADDGDGTQQDAEAPEVDMSARVAAEVESFNQRAEGWIFQIPAFKWGAINKRMDDLLKPMKD